MHVNTSTKCSKYRPWAFTRIEMASPLSDSFSDMSIVRLWTLATVSYVASRQVKALHRWWECNTPVWLWFINHLWLISSHGITICASLLGSTSMLPLSRRRAKKKKLYRAEIISEQNASKMVKITTDGMSKIKVAYLFLGYIVFPALTGVTYKCS